MPRGQLQIGLWLTTLQLAPTPQAPAQASMHFCATQAWEAEQSASTSHSGRQPSGLDGLPTVPRSQVQEAWPEPVTEQRARGPHGLGWQGSRGRQPVTGLPV